MTPSKHVNVSRRDCAVDIVDFVALSTIDHVNNARELAGLALAHDAYRWSMQQSANQLP